MKLNVLTSIVLLVACEGEPPKTPEIASTAPTASVAEPVATDETPAKPAATCAPCPVCGDAAAPVMAQADAGAPAVTADAGPPAPVRGEIAGTITTTPAYLASVAVAFLEDAPIEPGRGMRGRIDNHQMSFAPMVQVIAQGGSVTFNNSDPFPHNVFSPGNFNLGTIPQNSATAPRKFDKTGEYTLLCNLHPGMIGYLVVTPSSYFAKADAKGRYRIKDVPAGTYNITAWAPRLPVITQSITVGADEARSDFELHR